MDCASDPWRFESAKRQVRWNRESSHAVSPTICERGWSKRLKLVNEKENGQTKSVTDPIGNAPTTCTYNSSCDFASVTDPLGNKTPYGQPRHTSHARFDF